MLQKLKIKNIALIDECEIEFEKGFNTLTGETGAGKSIIIDALNFVLGARGDKSLIKSGTGQAKVEAVFDTDDQEVFSIMSEFGLEVESIIVLSRTMSLSGKNECRINGEVASLSMLKKLTGKLVDVFGQNDQQFLLNTKEHLHFLDAMDEKSLASYKEKLSVLLQGLKQINEDIKSLGGDGEERLRNIDILKYQINEITVAELQVDEEDVLTERKNVLRNAEKIIEKFNDFLILSDGQVNIVSNLKSMLDVLNSLTKYMPDYDALSERLSSAKIEIQDIVETVSDGANAFEYNEHELNEIEDRLDIIKALKRKYGSTVADVLAFQEKAVEELKRLENATEELEKLKADKDNALKEIYEVCQQLTETRKQISYIMSDKIKVQLQALGMKSADFAVDFAPYEFKNIEQKVNFNGSDEVEFLFSANLGEPLKPLVKIISGGEMSRFMLAFKTVINNFVDKTYVFDEIDTGIGGSIGSVVAKQMVKIATTNQVLCITHLAQIACFADNMLKIEKYEAEGRTFTGVKKLDNNSMVGEVTRLIGTNEVNDFAYKHAEELIKEAKNYKISL